MGVPLRSFWFAVLFLALSQAGFGFTLLDCSPTPTIGWPTAFDSSAGFDTTQLGTILVDDQGSALSSFTCSQTRGIWVQSAGAWQAVTDTKIVFPSLLVRPLEPAEISGILSNSDLDLATRVWTFVGPNTAAADGSRGWEAISGLGDTILGVAFVQFRASDCGLIDGDILINDDRGDAPTYFSPGVPESGLFDPNGVVTHEIGHFLGLNHSLDNTAIMFATAPSGTLESLNNDDAAGVLSLYQTPASVTKSPLVSTVPDQCLSFFPPIDAPEHPNPHGCQLAPQGPSFGLGMLLAWLGILGIKRRMSC